MHEIARRLSRAELGPDHLIAFAVLGLLVVGFLLLPYCSDPLIKLKEYLTDCPEETEP